MTLEVIGFITFFLISLIWIALANSWLHVQRINPRCRFGVDSYRQVKNYKLHFVEFGDGEPLLLLHDLKGTYRTWNSVLPGLSRHFRCIALDIIGMGQSDKPELFDYSLSSIADLIINFMEGLGFKAFHAMGIALGGSLVLNMAGRYPDHILHGISIEGFADSPGDVIIIEDKIHKILRLPITGHLFFLILRTGILSAKSVQDATRNSLGSLNAREKRIFQDELALAMFLSRRIPTLKLLKSHRTSEYSQESILNIRHPILQIYGANSVYQNALQPSFNLLKQAAAITQWVVKDGVHELHWQYPKWFIQTSVSFIKHKGIFAYPEKDRLWEIIVTDPN